VVSPVSTLIPEYVCRGLRQRCPLALQERARKLKRNVLGAGFDPRGPMRGLKHAPGIGAGGLSRSSGHARERARYWSSCVIKLS
jgi:hypothetical protein